MGRTCLALICLALAITRFCSAEENPKFPNIKSLIENGFMSRVEISGQPENSTVFVEEFYDATNKLTKLNILNRGHKQTIIMYGKSNQVATIENSACIVKSISEAEYIINPLFPNWLHSSEDDSETYYGPTSILRRASDKPPKYARKGTSRGIDCHTFADPDPSRKNINVKYFFTADWTTPANVSKSILLPVQIQLSGEGMPIEGSPDENFVQYVDYVYFVPAVKDQTIYELPFGIGCKGLKSDEVAMPDIPTRFTVEGEQFSSKDPSSEMSVNTFRVWYDYIAKLARIDIYSEDNDGISKVLDYNTGLMYVTKDNEECTSNQIIDSSFDEITGDLRLVMKDPDSAMGMKGDFYYLGKKFTRGIYCDVWESVVENYTVEDLRLNRIVYTYFISSRYWEIDVEGEVEEQVPIRLVINTYLEATGESATTHVFNFFNFRKHPAMVYSQFSIEFCANAVPDKKYIMILIDTDIDTARKAEKEAAEFRIAAQDQIIKTAGISPIRLPFIRVDFEPNSISIMALVLERAPAMAQFGYLKEDMPKKNESLIRKAKSKELCAEECINIEVCVGFHYCSGNSECYVSLLDWDDVWGEDITGPKSCVLYKRNEIGSSFKDVHLKDALDNLDKAIDGGNFVIVIPANPDEITVTASKFVPDFSPVTSGGHDSDMFSRVFGQMKFKATQTTRSDFALSAGECYRKCQKEENLACASFSFCDDTNECMLSSVLALPTKKADNYDLESSVLCTVYSIEYLQTFEEYAGQVRISPGKDAIAAGSPSECAKSCREKENPRCRGFDFCNQKNQCILHEKHVLDIKEGDLTGVGTGCSHYALKYIADYFESSRFVLRDPKAKTVFGLSAEKCAKTCSENMEFNCKSFDFCPSDESAKMQCILNTVTMNDGDSEDSETCQHYAKKAGVVDDFLYPKQTKVKAEKPPSGYTPNGLAGVIIGVLIFGIAVGIIGFLIYSYVRKRGSTDERSVRFMKQENA